MPHSMRSLCFISMTVLINNCYKSSNDKRLVNAEARNTLDSIYILCMYQVQVSIYHRAGGSFDPMAATALEHKHLESVADEWVLAETELS